MSAEIRPEISSGRTQSSIRFLRDNNASTQTRTHALRRNSPAIDAGKNNGDIGSDQRGQIRPFDFPSIPNAPGGDGSDIGAFERQANDISSQTLFDFDGDGKSDVSVFRPSNSVWYLLQSQNGFAATVFGLPKTKSFRRIMTATAKPILPFIATAFGISNARPPDLPELLSVFRTTFPFRRITTATVKPKLPSSDRQTAFGIF